MLICLAFVGCASLPKDYPRTPSIAFQHNESTTFGRFFEEAAAHHPGESGFILIRQDHHAFTDRIALTELAEKSLDLQYYIWDADTTGRILSDRLLRAADRGVRVRVLLDDNTLKGRDSVIAALNAHPNVEIRIFNPFAHRESHGIDFVIDLNRVNHRMHNKVMVMDNAVAIIGGRNIADHYFGVNTESNFRDLDIAAAGPVVRDISDSFDVFWNSHWSFPIEALLSRRQYTLADLDAAAKVMREKIAGIDFPYPLDQDLAELKTKLMKICDEFVWAPAAVVYDDPAALENGEEPGNVSKALEARLGSLQNELLIESAYFVQREPGVGNAGRLKERGIRVRVLTNSLASNDVAAAHAGHEKFRKQLLENGVELYELRPDSHALRKKWSVAAGKSKAALHTKAVVFDRDAVFIGSFNLDPRSAYINTEVGLMVESSELAKQLAAYMDEGVEPENSYRVTLDENGDIVWETEDEGRAVRYHVEPETTFWKRFMADLIKILPVESQL